MRTWGGLFAAAFAVLLHQPVSAATVVQTLGDQDFADGATPIMAADFTAARDATDIADGPFNTLFGSDIGVWTPTAGGDYTPQWGPVPGGSWALVNNAWVNVGDGNGTHDYTYAYTPGSGTYSVIGSNASLDYSHAVDLSGGAVSATLEIGLYDHDSFASLSDPDVIDISFFDIVAGVWVQQDTSVWDGVSVSDSSVHVRQMAVDADLLNRNGGILQVMIATTASGGGTPVDGILWHTGNSIGVDFSRLTVATVPLPAPALLLLGGLGALGALRRRR